MLFLLNHDKNELYPEYTPSHKCYVSCLIINAFSRGSLNFKYRSKIVCSS